jgi:hypothetical protein
MSWTKFDDHTTMEDAVAYGWGGWDSVAGFNTEIAGQIDAIANKRAEDENYAALNWQPNSPLAPGADWDNYLFPARRIATTVNSNPNFDYYYYPGEHTAAQINAATQHNFYTNGSAASVPGLSTFLTFCRNERNPALDEGRADLQSYWNYASNQVSRTAGLDCSGLVSRCANYPDSSYVIGDGVKRNTTGLASDVNSWMVDDINLLIPGDILVDPGSHVVFVLFIEYENNTRTIADISDMVFVIEATQGLNNEWCVINEQTWDDLIGDYEIKRLRE